MVALLLASGLGWTITRTLTRRVGRATARLTELAVAIRGLVGIVGRYLDDVRIDAGVFLGLTSIDPTIGFTAGFTYVFNAFTIP